MLGTPIFPWETSQGADRAGANPRQVETGRMADDSFDGFFCGAVPKCVYLCMVCTIYIHVYVKMIIDMICIYIYINVYIHMICTCIV